MWPINETLPIPLSQDLICIALLEMDGPLLADMDQNVFQKIQQLAAGCRKILWIGLNGTGESSPFFRVVDGLFRVLNSEDSRGIFTTLSIDSTGFQADQVTRVLRAMVSSTELETEYVEKRGFLHIPRLVEAPRLSHAVRRLQSSQYPTRLQWNSAPPLKLAIGPAGMLDGLQFVEDVDRKAPLPADMLEIKVKAVGANFRDVLVLLGRMDQTTLGFECAGVVTRVGKECTDFQVGDQVLGCNFDSYRSYARLHQAATIKVPSGMSFSHAAAIPTNFVTAWHTLVSIANVQSDETVLIHSAAGGTGQAAIQVAQYLGANVFATVGNAEKKTFLMKRYGIPESHIFSSRNTDFAACIKRLTSGKGVDVLLNSLSGEGLVASWECIAPYGRFLEIGKRDILAHAQLDMFHFARNVTFSAVDLALVVQERPHLIGKALRALMPLVSAGTLRVSEPLRVYGINELETGLRKLQGGQSSGKVVFEMRDHDVIDVFSPLSPTTSVFC
jgi:NADPH:quinone reductase-like Zn-dependent oxidoreductase